jgi:predicted nucleotidyltransferase
MNLQKDLKEFVELLNGLDVRFLIVGAFAVAYHGYPRYTSDVDIFVENSAENAKLLMKAIHEFGFGDIGLTKEDFMRKDQVIQLGIAPNRIDVMTFISGVSFEEAWASRELGELGGVTLPFISREMLKRNKAASGRKQDLADLEQL